MSAHQSSAEGLLCAVPAEVALVDTRVKAFVAGSRLRKYFWGLDSDKPATSDLIPASFCLAVLVIHFSHCYRYISIKLLIITKKKS